MLEKRKKTFCLVELSRDLLPLLFLLLLVSCKTGPKNTKISGQVFGTTYTVIYDSSVNYQKQFDNLFYEINRSMSTYIANSDISKLNSATSGKVDHFFIDVLGISNLVNHQTDGAFDPTIGVVVNAWDFGPEGKVEQLDSLKIDSLMQYVGLNKVKIRGSMVTKPKETFIDFNAIAKGYAVDIISSFLEFKVDNFLVEIGGELYAKGINVEKKAPWKVGLDEPRFDGGQSVFKAITLKNEAMATSGTYRKFKIDENGNRYAHIINPKTGYPSKTNVLSVSVIAPDCARADAYATAFKAMGIDKVKTFMEKHPELKTFLIFENDNNDFETLSLNGFPEL